MSYKLLIVDDDTDLLSILGDIFREDNYSVITCSDGSEAIDKCRHTTFDIVITDIMLPGANGIDILRAVKRDTPETIVILITGYASLETAINAVREGAYDYITKPFKLEQIRLVVKNACEKIALIKENKQLLKELEKAYEELRLIKRILGTNGPSMDAEADRGGSITARDKTLISDDLTPHLLITQTHDASDSFVDNLERISALHDRGLITTREFEICKAKLFQNLK